MDTLVTCHLTHELLQPDQLRETLASLWAGRAAKQAEVDGRVTALRAEVTNAQDKLRRLYQLVEDGVTDLDDMLKVRASRHPKSRSRSRLGRARPYARRDASTRNHPASGGRAIRRPYAPEPH
jgi:site-specific DNA recombinase